jgi:hypothetical protein
MSLTVIAVMAWVVAVVQLRGNAQTFPATAQAQRAVERMRGTSMTLQGGGKPTDRELTRREITRQLHDLGPAAIAALVQALRDPDVQMRRNAALALINLGGGYSPEAKPPLDTRAALPSLIDATRDADADVRGWSAHAIAEIGAAAQPAIPALLELLHDPEVGPRNTSCMALGRIGPAAREALPALRDALNDPSSDVRRFAQIAIGRIEGR